MPLVSSNELLKSAARDGYGIPSFCVWSAETIEITLKTANAMRAPVLIMSGPGEFPALDPEDIADVAKLIGRKIEIPFALHLDHGDSVELAERCVRAGFTSVMLDYSLKSYDENVAGTREVVALARPHGVTVEGEIGTIGRAETSSDSDEGVVVYTEVSDAKRFADDTKIDIIAVSIGNRHGFYAREPQLNVRRAKEIYDAVGIPLVLHGGTGTPLARLRELTKSGVAKINVASEIVHGMREDLMRQWSAKENLWLPTALGHAKEIARPILEKWLTDTGAAGRA